MCILKCAGKQRVGFLSGERYDATTLQGEPNKRIMRGRIVFSVASLLVRFFAMTLIRSKRNKRVHSLGCALACLVHLLTHLEFVSAVYHFYVTAYFQWLWKSTRGDN